MNKFIFSRKGFTVMALLLYFFAKAQTPDANGIIYVTENGTGNGSSWSSPTNNLQGAINAAGVTKVFVAIGNYDVPSPSSFVMKNGVTIYGGFDPGNDILTLDDNRILPDANNNEGSVLNGQNERPVIWNVFTSGTAMNNTAVLDGFTLKNGYYASEGGAIRNVYASPMLSNLVIRNNTASNGGGIFNSFSSPVITNTVFLNNTATVIGGGIYNSNSSNPVITNAVFKSNSATNSGTAIYSAGTSLLTLTNAQITNNSGNFAIVASAGSTTLNNVTIANNGTYAARAASGTINLNNSVVFGVLDITGTGVYNTQYSFIQNNAGTANGNINTTGISITDVFTNPSAGDYSLKAVSLINKGSNALFPSLNASTKDLAGNTRLVGSAIDVGAYEYSYSITPTDGIVYVKETPSGNASGSSWNDATNDLHNAIHTNGVQKVFVGTGNYNVGAHSFIMKNNVAIYGGFDPDNGISDLSHNRIMPNPANTQGSVLNGENVRPVVWNVFTAATAMNNTAVLDGFTVMNGNYSNGAGIRNLYASPTLRNLVIRDNNATLSGAGIYNDNSSPTIINSVINGNSINSAFAQSGMGAGIYNGTNSAPTLINTTITDNRLTGIGAAPVMVGAGVANHNGAAPEIYNSIIWNNKKNNEAATSGADIENISAGITLKNSITQSYSTGNSGDNNLVGVNPLFADNSFTIPMTSPAVNAGNNSYLSPYGGTGETDLAGNPRLSSQSVDIGAYEYQLNITPTDGIVYIKETGTGNGSSWEDATGWLHDAIHTNGVQKVFVAIGNYNVGDHSFIMKNGVEIYGGFDPDNNIKTLDDNRILPNQTAGEGSVLNGQNARPVIWNVFTSGTAMNNTAVLDGFTLKNGYTSVSDGGGGISNGYASPTLRNLVIKNNESYFSGGGITNKYYSSPNLTNVIIKNNTAITGGGMYNYLYSNPTLNNVDFIENQASNGGGFSNNYRSYLVYTNGTVRGNTAQNSGGGIEHYNSDEQDVLMLTNVSVTGNTSGGSGGGIWNYGYLVCNKVLIKGNSSEYYGGGIYQLGEHLTLEQVLIANNETDEDGGGGLYLEGSSSYVYDFKNSTIVNNQPQAIFSYNSAPMPVISNSIIVGEIEGGIVYNAQSSFVNDPNITAEDLFTNPAAEDYTLKINSPAIDAGNDALFIGLDENTTDLGGNPRLIGSSIDRGAYEYASPFTDGIIYVKETATGNETGTSWENATSDLHNAIHTVEVQKVFVAIGNYNVGDHSFIMKNNVEIYGGFDPDNDIKTLDDERILPNRGTAEGSVLNGQNVRPVIWNVVNTVNNTAVLDGFTIKNGTTSDKGGGIHNIGASPVYRNLVVKNNSANSDGGGIYISAGSPVFTDLVIQNNNTGHYGGGIYTGNSSSPKITNAVIKGNTSYESGTGLCNEGNSSPVLTNVLFTGNSAGNTGTANAVISRSGYVELRNVTIVNNVSINGGVRALTALSLSGGSIGVYNSVIFGSIDGNISIKQSFLQGNTNISNGNIDATGIADTDIFTNPATGDYTLKSNSVAIDAGEEDFYAGLDANTKDLAGNARVYQYSGGGVLDLGAYESSYSAFPYVVLTPDVNGIIYVKETATGDMSGSSWNNATANLKKSIHAIGVQQVWVATGTYPAYNIVLKNDVAVYGGFDPDNGIVDLTHNRILPNPDANIQGAVINGQTLGRIITNDSNGLNSTAILDGFTLVNGRSTIGAGMYNNGASPTLRNLWIKANAATSDGGGMYNINSASPVMTNITIEGNTASYGSGVFNRSSSSPVMSNVIIKNNTANNDGGGMYNDISSSPVMTNVKIIENSAQNGAGMYNRTNSSPVLVNALIADNTAAANGGAIRNDANSSPSLTNATVVGNTGSTTLFAPSGITSFANSIVYGTVISGTYTAQYSLVQGSSATTNGNIDATGITIADVFSNPPASDYTLKNGSIAVNVGSNVLFTGLDENTLDLAGNLRLFGAIIDMGAYEQNDGCFSETIWNGTSWSKGIPNATTKAIIEGNLTLTENLTACELLLNSGILTVNSGVTFTVNGEIVNTQTKDNFIVQSDANLIQVDNVENEGAITVKRSTFIKHLDYTIWSSPVIGQGLQAFSPQTLPNRIRIYNGAVSSWTVTTGNFVSGKGFMFRAPNVFDDGYYPNTYTWTGTFTGVPENGEVTVEFTNIGTYQSLGNPYPSNIDREAFHIANPNIGTLYFWTNTNPYNSAAGEYTGVNWATINSLGDAVASVATLEGEQNSLQPSGIISVGQGFVAQTNGVVTQAIFNNNMRTSQSGVFFRTMMQEKHRFWLNLSDENQVFNQMLVGYMDQATNGEDFGIDAGMFNYSGSALYSLIGSSETNFVIQGRSLPFDDFDVVPLGFRATKAGNYIISLADFDGVFTEGQDIFIRDNFIQTEQNLKNGNYTFVSENGTFDNRFEIIYREGTMSVSNPDLTNNWIIYKKDDVFHIRTQGFEMKEVVVYDMLGRTIYTSKAEGNSHTVSRIIADQILIVKITTTDNQILNKKIQN